MTNRWTSEDEVVLSQTLNRWRAPPASPWLGSRIANSVIADSRVILLPWAKRTRIAALAVALVVGWGVGVTVAVPEPVADGIEVAELFW